MGFFSVQANNDSSYTSYFRFDDVSLEPIEEDIEEEIALSGGFFKDKEIINFSLNKAKENESFNALMIENADLSVNGNNIHTKNIVINQVDRGNIIAIKASKLLQEKIDKENPNYGMIILKLNQFIEKELNGVNASDINLSDWVNKNPLTKSLLSCIKYNHDQANIDAVISDRVIQYYQYKMDAQFSSDLDYYVKKAIDKVLTTATESNADKITSEDRAGINRGLHKIGDKPSSERRNAIYIQNHV
ncbi:hypothetical protein [Yersinia enterocolitica]|uniref:hypothetical protein n=1 Tax=Yersinia enterocolitica TaxID=630 RepID=UPI000976CD93|nr:hypothetical protein [Yersinia enterocolitica]ELI7922796.1 hypothetical protein [Yersinia enterocolitica]